MLMNVFKQDYECPTTDVLELRVETGILQTSGQGEIPDVLENDFGLF